MGGIRVSLENWFRGRNIEFCKWYLYFFSLIGKNNRFSIVKIFKEKIVLLFLVLFKEKVVKCENLVGLVLKNRCCRFDSSVSVFVCDWFKVCRREL